MFDYYSSVKSFKEANGYDIDGVWYPRVTKIVGIKAKPALLRFYAEAENFKLAQSVTQKSAEEGTLVHETAEKILLGQETEIAPSVAPAIAAFKNFLEQKNVQTMPEYVERRIVHHGERYAGTIDVMALVDGKFGVLDIKTSQGIYRDYNLQTAAYMEALKNEFPNLQTRWILRIDQIKNCLRCGALKREKGGREKIKIKWNNPVMKTCGHEWSETIGEIEFQEFPFWEKDFEGFLGAKKLWEWENEEWLKKAGYF